MFKYILKEMVFLFFSFHTIVNAVPKEPLAPIIPLLDGYMVIITEPVFVSIS